MAPERTAMGIAVPPPAYPLLGSLYCAQRSITSGGRAAGPISFSPRVDGFGSDLCTWIKIEHIAIVHADAQHLAPAIPVCQEHGWLGCPNQSIRTDPHARAQLHHCSWLPLRSRRRA